MRLRMSLLLAVVILFVTAGADETIDEEEIAYAVVESCNDCQLRRFPQVKKFISEDLPLYDRVKYALMPNAFPSIVYRNKHDQEIDRVYITYMNQEECNTLLKEKGFRKKEKPKAVAKKRDAVPEKRDVVPEKPDAVPENRDAVPEKRDAVPEKRDAVPEKCNAVPENRDAVPENRDAAPEKRQQDSSDQAKEEL